jgi:chromosome segregation ATPase
MASEDIFQLSERLSQFKTTQDTVVTKLTAISSDISNQLKDVHGDLVQFKKEKENIHNMGFRLEVMEAELGKLRTKLNLSDDTIETTLKDETAIRSKVSELIGKVVDMETRLNEAESSFLSRLAHIDAVSAEVSKIHLTIEHMENVLDYHENDSEGHKTRIELAHEQLDEIQEALGKATTSALETAKEVGILKQSLAGFTNDISRLNGKLAELGSRLDNASSERNTLAENVKGLTSRLDGVQENVSTAFLVKDEVDRNKRELEEHRDRIKDLQRVSTQIISRLQAEEETVKEVLERESKKRLTALEKDLSGMVDERIKTFTARLDEEAKQVEARAATLEEWSKRMAAKEKEIDSGLARLGVVKEGEFETLKGTVSALNTSMSKMEKGQAKELKQTSERQERDHGRLKKLETKMDKTLEMIKELSDHINKINDKVDLLQF